MFQAFYIDLYLVQVFVYLTGSVPGQSQLLLVEVDVDLIPHNARIFIHKVKGRTHDEDKQDRADQYQVLEVQQDVFQPGNKLN